MSAITQTIKDAATGVVSKVSNSHIASSIVNNDEHLEGPVARAIEAQTAKLPSDLFLWAAVGSIAASLGLQIAQKKVLSLFVGQWAPTFLVLGLYNKLVKTVGSDQLHQKVSGAY